MSLTLTLTTMDDNADQRRAPDTSAVVVIAAACLMALGVSGSAQVQPSSTDWPSQNLNLDNNRFAPLERKPPRSWSTV